MGCLAVLFALNEQDVEKLRSIDRKDRSAYMHEEIEELFFDSYPEYMCELDKAWDAMHRMLTDGNLNFENQFPPFFQCHLRRGTAVWSHARSFRKYHYS